MDRQLYSKRSVTNLPRQVGLGGYNETIKRTTFHSLHHLFNLFTMTPQEYKEHIKKDTIKIGQDLSEEVDNLPWDDYEGNLLNYFYGMTPQESKRFNKMKKDHGVK